MKAAELDRVSDKLTGFVGEFDHVFGWKKRSHYCSVYLSGLILDGERKSVEPMAQRIEGADDQALQQFVSQSPWDGFALQTALRRSMVKRFRIASAIYVLDDTSLPKKGENSVGVARQYCGALGKIANCQSLVSLQAVSKRVHFPLAARLYLPEVWTNDVGRMKRAGVPAEQQAFQEKWRIALDLLDECRQDCEIELFLFDAGYGSNRLLLADLDQRSVNFIGQIRCDDKFWDADMTLDEPKGGPRGRGRPRHHVQPTDRSTKPFSAKEWADQAFSKPSNVRRVRIAHQKPVAVEIVARRVLEVVSRPPQRVGPERWLVVERLRDGTYKYYVSNLGPDVSPKKIIRLAHERWKVEQGYQQLKEELGLDHFEGRSWQGLHHHIALCFMAYDFLQIIVRSKGRGKKGAAAAPGNSSLAQ